MVPGLLNRMVTNGLTYDDKELSWITHSLQARFVSKDQRKTPTKNAETAAGSSLMQSNESHEY